MYHEMLEIHFERHCAGVGAEELARSVDGLLIVFLGGDYDEGQKSDTMRKPGG